MEIDKRSWLRRMRMGSKLGIAFGSLLFLVAVTAAVSIDGLMNSRAGYQRALGFGAAFADKTVQARAELLGARRREKEFLQRWPQVGINFARETWLQRSAALANSLAFPIDAQTTAVAHLDDARTTLREIAVLLKQGARTHVEDQFAGEDNHHDIKRLSDTTAKLQKDVEQYRAQLLELASLLAERGDLDGAPALPATPSSTAANLSENKQIYPARVGGLRALTHSLGLALAATEDDKAPDTTPGRARAVAVYAWAEMAREEERYLRRLDTGLPRPDPPKAEDSALTVDREVALNPCDASPTALAGENEQRALDWRGATSKLAGLLPADAAWSQNPRLLLAKHELAVQEFIGDEARLAGKLRRFLCIANDMEAQLDDFSELGPKAIAALTTKAEDAASGAAGFVGVISAICLMLGTVLAIALARDIRIPVKELASTAQEVANGDLTARAWVYSEDEIGQLATTFNAMTGKLQEQSTAIAQQLHDLEEERDRSERLLLNVLPFPIAERLKGKEHPIADHFQEASVLFADVVGYTALSSRLAPTQVVERLGQIFTAFDNIAQRYGVEKIKTIGDAYMAACGLPRFVPDHRARLANMALDMLVAIEELNRGFAEPMQLRIGLNAGSVVAGVIGERKFIYDLWGDAVNVASRMESHGVPGAIQVSEEIYNHLQTTHLLQPRGVIEVKGKGPMRTWLLLGRIPDPVDDNVS